MSTRRIQHCPSDGEEQFQVVRVGDSKTTKPVAVAPPVGFPVAGRPDSDLMRELRWYLEDFLGYPFPPETEHADRVLEALGKWGRQAFDALFDNRKAGDFLRGAMDQGRYDRLNLQIASDDPRVLAWPWEALEDSQAGPGEVSGSSETGALAQMVPRSPRSGQTVGCFPSCAPPERDSRAAVCHEDYARQPRRVVACAPDQG